MIELPFPPTLNSMFATVGKRRVLSKRGRAYRVAVRAAVLEQHGIVKPIHGPIKVYVWFYQPDKRRRDIDNLFKALFDALQKAGCFADDSQIKELEAVMREPDGNGPGCCVVLESLS